MKQISRRDFIKVGGSATALALTGISCGSPKAPVNRKPNILFLITDQHRGNCIGCDGNGNGHGNGGGVPRRASGDPGSASALSFLVSRPGRDRAATSSTSGIVRFTGQLTNSRNSRFCEQEAGLWSLTKSARQRGQRRKVRSRRRRRKAPLRSRRPPSRR